MKTVPMNQSISTSKAGADRASTKGARRATGVEALPGDRKIMYRIIPPDPEVPEKKRRRKFTAKYKLRILSEAEL